MAEPVLREYRTIVNLPNGGRGFLVSARLEDPGSGTQSLPFPEIFVMTIVDAANPKADVLARIATPFELRKASVSTVYVKLSSSDITYFGTDPFARVANVAELTQLARDRDTALARKQTEYLSPAVSFLYTDVATANAAYRTLVDRVSQLVADWVSFRDTFTPVVPPYQDYTLPQVSIGVENELKAAYTAAKQARQSAETTRDAAKKAKDDCALKDQLNAARRSDLDADIAFLSSTVTTVTGIDENASAVVSPATPGVSAIVTQTHLARDFVLGTDPRSLATLLAKKRASLTALSAAMAAEAVVCGQLTDALLSSQAALAQAQAAEAAALAAVLAVCPTFDPATV